MPNNLDILEMPRPGTGAASSSSHVFMLLVGTLIAGPGRGAGRRVPAIFARVTASVARDVLVCAEWAGVA